MVLRIAPDLRPIRVEKRRRQDDRAGVGGVHGEIAHGRQHVEPLARQRRFRRAEPVAAAGESERRQQRGPPRERAAAEAAGPARCLVAHSERRAKSAAARPRTPCGALGSPLRSVRVFSAAFLSPRAISISDWPPPPSAAMGCRRRAAAEAPPRAASPRLGSSPRRSDGSPKAVAPGPPAAGRPPDRSPLPARG